MADTNIALLGLGNILLRDEGVGVHIVKSVEQNYQFSPPISIIDGGTSGSDILPIFEENQRILIVDAVNFGKDPGHIGILQNDEILAQLTTKLTMHHIGLADVLSSVKLLEYTHDEICLLGIQPDIIDTGLELSELLQSQLDKFETAVLNKLQSWNVKITKIPKDAKLR
jgi:hydrogenase maturation protease